MIRGCARVRTVFRGGLAGLALGFVAACQSAQQPLQPPVFEYRELADRFFRKNLDGQFPLTVQRGANLHAASAGNFLFYTSNRDGNGDIWMRDLRNTVNIPLIRHPSEQYKPAISPRADRLIFVSEDADSSGDLRLANVEPQDFVDNTVNGLPPSQVWDESISLSDQIEALAAAMEPACQGEAAETDPAFSPDGTRVLFTSDRCTSGVYNVWLLNLDPDAVGGDALKRLTDDGGVQPRFTPDGSSVIYVVPERGAAGGIRLLNLENGATLKPGLPERTAAGRPILYFDPTVGFEKRDGVDRLTLYYASIRADANRDGQIDSSDRAGLYSADFADAFGPAPRERQLLDNSTSIQSLIVSDFIGGALLYAAELYNSVNIYFIRPGGVIPEEPTIDAQYRLAAKYRNSAETRYMLALDAVTQYFFAAPERPVYVARTLVDRLDYYSRQGDRDAEQRILAEIQTESRSNPYAALQLEIYRAGLRAQPSVPLLQAFVERLARTPAPYDAARAAVVRAAALDELAQAYLRHGAYDRALAAATELNREYSDYLLRNDARLLQGRLELQKGGTIPAIFTELLADPAVPPIFHERISDTLFEFYFKDRTPAAAIELVGRELARGDLPPLIQASLRLVEARALFEDKNYNGALEKCNALRPLIRTHVPPGGVREEPLPGWRTVYIRVWQTIAYAQEKLGAYAEAYSAKLTYGGAYSPEAQVAIDTEDFVQIIEDGERQINLFLRTARSISLSIREQDAEDQSAVNQALGALAQTRRVDIGGVDLDVLVDFCTPNSSNGVLFLLLGPRYTRRYIEFCATNRSLLDERRFTEFPRDQAGEAADLLYVGAYANGNILNLLFMNMSRLGVLEKLYRDRAVHYQRAKIDAAAEKNRLLLERQEQSILFLSPSDVAGVFREQDPYNSETYDEILYVYRTVQREAAQAGDLSMIYGHAYTLIKKSVEKEAFYGRLQEQAFAQERQITERIQPGGVGLPGDLLREKKEETLRDLKTAEYLLQYMLNVDPLNTDAYLLLGWLYQYLDEQQAQEVRTLPTLLEDTYYLLTRTEPIAQTDRTFYSDLYKIYFPENFYETNVELYRQALEKITPANAAPEALAALHLNLANNYFRLLNFKRAIENYRLTGQYMAQAGAASFDDYRQNALYHFNLGRALYYDGQPEEGAKELLLAYELYDRLERKPLHEKFSTLSFLMRARDEDIAGRRESPAVLKFRQAELLKGIDQVRVKMALLAALIGLAQWEAGRYDEAILFYRDAEFRLYGDGAQTPVDGAVDRSSLMNFIALALQSKGDYDASDERSEQAGRFARDSGLQRDDTRFQPRTVGGRALGCILPYGEDFSVIGEGRNPFGFSPLRHYELSLGIQLENRILQGDLAGAAYLLRQRRQVFRERDFDVRLGRVGAIAALNQQGLNEFRARDFETAARSFRTAAEEARDFALLQSFRLNFSNRFKALFAWLEREDVDPEIARSAIAEGLDEVEVFRNDYRDEVKRQFIEERRQEAPEYEFDEVRDTPALNSRVNRQLLDILIIEASLRYYRARLLDRAASSDAEISAAHDEYVLAEKLFSETLSLLAGLGEANSVRTTRIRLNRARTYRHSGRLLEARRELADLIEVAYEFNLGYEEWYARYLLAQTEERLAALYNSPRSLNAAEEHYRRALDLALDSPSTYALISRNADEFFETAAEFYLRRGRRDLALQILERQWELHMHWQFLRNPLQFKDGALHEASAELRRAHLELAALDRDESSLRLARRDLTAILKRKEELRRIISATQTLLLQEQPGWRIFVKPAPLAEPAQPELGPGQIVYRFFPTESGVATWCFTAGREQFIAPAARDDRAAISAALRACSVRGLRDVFIVSDRRLFAAPYETLAREAGLPPPAFYTRLSDTFAGFYGRGAPADERTARLNLFNVRTRLAYASEGARNANADIIALRAPDSAAVFRAGQRLLFDARIWLSEERYASLAIADWPRERGPMRYQEMARLYETLRARGVGSMAALESGPAFAREVSALLQSDEAPQDSNVGDLFAREREDVATVQRLLDARGSGRYQTTGLRLFGASGFDRTALTPTLERMFVQTRDRALAREEAGDLNSARNLYRLAESLLWETPSARARGFDTRLALARLDLRLELSARGRKRAAEALLADYADDAERLPRVYDAVIETLLEAGDIPNARSFSALYIQRFPERRARIQQKTALLEFVSRARRRQYGDSAEQNRLFAATFERLYPEILQSGLEAYALGDLLVRHGQYAEAARLARDLTRIGSNPGEARRLRFELEMNAWLLGYGPPPADIDPGDASLYAHMLYRAQIGDWAAYDAALERIPAGTNLAVSKFRRRLFEQWRAYMRAQPVNLIDVSDVTIPDGATAYQAITPLERALVFRLLTDNIGSDPELQTAQTLTALIRAEKRSSETRQSQLALGAAEAYFTANDFSNALRFFELQIDAEKDALPQRERDVRSARLGAALSISGLPEPLRARLPGWVETLRASGAAQIAEVYFAVAQTLQTGDPAAWNRAVALLEKESPGSGPLSLSAQLRAGAALLKRDAARKQAWQRLLDTAIHEQELENYLLYRAARGRLPALNGGRTPALDAISAKLFERLPRGQSFIALVDTPDAAYRLMHRNGALLAIELKASGRYLRGRMRQYLTRTRAGVPANDVYQDLARNYRSLFPIGQGGIIYVWLPGVHSLAPLPAERGDRIFMALNPRALAAGDRRSAPTGREYANVNAVSAIGQSAPPRGVDGDNLLFYSRLAAMERLSLPEQSRDPGAVRHIFAEAYPMESGGFSGLPAAISAAAARGAWFFAGNRLGLNAAAEYEEAAYLAAALGESLEGAGVLTLRLPRSFAHAFFVRQFYSDSLREPDISRRFVSTTFNLRRTANVAETDAANYRVATGSFLEPVD